MSAAVFSNPPACLPPSSGHKSRPHWRFLLHRLLTPINRASDPGGTHCGEIYALVKRTRLLICLQVGGLSAECRGDIAAVKGEIAQDYLPGTEEEGSPRLG